MKFLISPKLVVGLLFLLFSSQLNSQTIDELKSQISEINNVIIKAVLENDSEKMLLYYTDDAISLPSYEPMIIGLEALQAHGEKNKNAPYKMNEFTLKTIDVFTEGSLVVEVGRYSLLMEMMGAPEPIKDAGKYITIFQKQSNGSLKIKLDMWNTNMNPWMSKPNTIGNKKHVIGKYCSKCGHKNCSSKCEGVEGIFCIHCGEKDCNGKCMIKKDKVKKEIKEKMKDIKKTAN